MEQNANRASSSYPLCVEVSSKGITNEQELVAYATRCNAITMKYRGRKLFNLEYLIRRYRQIKDREERLVFIQEHDCKNCLYNQYVSKCLKRRCCIDDLLQAEKDRALAATKADRCPHDIDGTCVYANESGRCFGFCMRDILASKKEKKNS